MLVITNNFTGENEEFEDSGELKKFLSYQNPMQLKIYKAKLKEVQPTLIIEGIGTGIKMYLND